MFLLKKKNILGLILCTLVLSASVPMLMGIEATPGSVFGGDMVALSQVDSSQSLDASLVDELNAQPNVEAASAEISCFSIINNFPVVVRGVDLDNFLEIENCYIEVITNYSDQQKQTKLTKTIQIQI